MQLSYSSVASDCGEAGRARAGSYAWLVFALTFGLLLSDYMSRQVLNAVFPLLKAEWGLSDTRLGTLSVVVSLAVGALAFPLALLSDRFAGYITGTTLVVDGGIDLFNWIKPPWG